MKNRNIPYYVAALMLATGVSTSFVSCVDTDEPSSIEELRKAKANEVNAQAAYKNALAQTQLQTAEIEKAKAAQAAIDTQIKDLERQKKESDLTVTKAKNELEVLKTENGKVHEKAIAALVEVKDARWLTAEKARAIDTALIYDARVAEKEAELKQLKDKAEADLASAAAKLQKQINDTKRYLISLDMESSMRNAEQSDSVLIYAAENDEIAANLLTAKQNADGLVTKTFDAWIQAKLSVLKAQSKLTEAQYDLDVVSNADGGTTEKPVLGEISLQYAEKGVENAKLATAAAQKNLTDLQALKTNTDYQSWITAYENAQKYIDVDLANRTIERQKTLADKKKAKITAEAAEKLAENTYNDFAKTQKADKKAYDEIPNFYEYDLKDAANTYANLIDYISGGKQWEEKLGKKDEGGSAYPIKQGNADDVKANFAFNNSVSGVFFVSHEKKEGAADYTEAPIMNKDYATKIAVLYKDGKEGDASVFGQFIANTKTDTKAKEDAEKAHATIKKKVMGSDGKGINSTDTEEPAVKVWNSYLSAYTTAISEYNKAKKAYDAKKNDNNVSASAKEELQKDMWKAGATLVSNKTKLAGQCQSLFGTDYAKQKIAKVADNTPSEVEYKENVAEAGDPQKISNFNEDKFILALPVAEAQKLTDEAYSKYGTYSEYLKGEELTIPEWTRKVKADAEAAKFVKEVKAKSTGQSITETLDAIAKKQDELTVAVITALNSDDAKKALADWQTKKAATAAAEDAVEMYEEYYKKGTDGKYTDEVAHAKAVVDKAIQDETEAQKTLVELYKTLIETLYNKTYTPSGEGAKALTYDPKTYDELYAKAEIALKKAVEEAKDAQATAEAKLEAAQKGEKYTTGTVTFDVFYVTAAEKDKTTSTATPTVTTTAAAGAIAKPNVNIQKLEYKVEKNSKSIATSTKEDYIEALKAAVTETQSNVNDLNTQYEAAKKLYEEAMTKVAEYMKAN